MRNRASLHGFAILAITLGLLAGCSRQPAPSDAQIATSVQGKLAGDSNIQSHEIGVQAANGVVTLSGSVNSDSERNAAAGDAATIAGVKTVVNNLLVQQVEEASPATSPQPARKQAKQKRDHIQKPGDAANANQANLQATNMPPPPPVQQAPPAPPQPPPPPKKITIPAGTQLTVRLNDPLDSEKNQVGDTWHGTLSVPVSIDGETVIPSGADITGRVADVKSAGRFAGNSVLTLELTSLSVNGKTYGIQTNQWSRAGKGEGKNTATKAVGGAALGAIIGGLAGGGKGAGIGSVAGAGAGTGVAAAKKGQQIKLGPESTLSFQMVNSLTVIPQGSNGRNEGRTPLS